MGGGGRPGILGIGARLARAPARNKRHHLLDGQGLLGYDILLLLRES